LSTASAVSTLRAARALLCLLVVGCAAPEAPAALEPSATFTAEQIFGPLFFNPQARSALMQPGVALKLPEIIEQDRYRFLQVTELRRVNEEKRVGEVAFSIDGWPAQLGVELTHTTAGWRLSGVDDVKVQQGIVEVLGIEGLPRSHSAEPWPGGLAGRDAAGRPTAAALVMVTHAGLWIDGQRVPPDAAAVKAAIAAALAARQQLAWVAHATYRPHVALALPATEPATRHAELARWAIEAGAEALMLIVRDPQGGPAFLPLAHTAPTPEGEVAAPHVLIQTIPTGLRLVMGDAVVEIPANDPAALRPAVEGFLGATALIVTPTGTHAQHIALLDDLRGAGRRPIATGGAE
jgi:hypothetical protein